MNQNFYNSNSSGFDQTQPPRFPVIHPPPQEISIESLHDQENVINAVQTFLRKFNRISFFETPKVLLLAWDRVFEIKDALGNIQYKPEDIKELFRKLLDDLQNTHEELAEYINAPGWNRPAFYDDDDDDDVDYTIATTPVLSTEEPDNSLCMGDEHLDTIPTTESDEVIKFSVKDLVSILSEFEGIPDTMCDVHLNIEYVEASPHDSELVSLEVAEIVIPEDEKIEDDNLREKLLKVNLLIAKIEALKNNSTPSSEFLTKSSSTFPKSVLEETNTFDDSLPEFENFCFDLEEISSGGTTTHFDISLPDYEAFSFYDGHIEEISSGYTTTHSGISLSEYDSFIFDLSNDQCPPTDRSDFTHEEFADELGYIISPPEYDCFYFRNLPDLGEWISSLNSRIRENLSSTTRVNLPVEDDHLPLLAYVVWIFLAYLMYPVIPPHLHSFENKDTIFDPGVTINRFYSLKPGLSHRCGSVKKFNSHRSHLNECPMMINGKNTPILDNIEYVEASPHDSELVSLEVAEIVIPEDKEIEDDNLCEKLLKVNLLIAKIEALKDNSTPSSDDDDYLYYENIKYVEASPHDFEFVILEVEKIVIPEDEEIDDDNLREKLLKVLLLAWDRVFKFKDALGNTQYKPEDIKELFRKLLDDLQNIHEELAEYINAPGWNLPAFYDDDDDDDVDYTIAITPVLSTEEPDNSLSMGDEHLDTIPATESDEVIKSSVKDLVPIPSESEGIPDTMCDVHLVNNPTPLEAKDHFEIVINFNDDYSSSDDDSLYNENIEYVEASPHDFEFVSLEVAEIVIPKDKEIEDDNLCEKLLKVNLLIAKIEALKDNSTPSSEFLTKSSSTFPKSISSGSTTTHSNISFSEYDSFIFDLLNDHCPPTDRSDFTHDEFAVELAHIISSPKYNCFYFENLPDSGEWISSLNSGIRENLCSTTRVNLPVEDDHSPLLAYVVWIFLTYLTYPVIPPHLYLFGNKDTIFDPGITINRFYSFKPGLSHRCGSVKKFNSHRSHLNECPMMINGKNTPILDVPLFHFYPP
nr:hypothetical protein [Tanacetum cinerariifolium]